MKKYIVLLLVLLALAAVASAAEKKDELRYEVNVSIRFNSLNTKELVEVQKVLDGLAAKSCKTKIELEKLPKDSATSGTISSGTDYVYTLPQWLNVPDTNSLVLKTEEDEN